MRAARCVQSALALRIACSMATEGEGSMAMEGQGFFIRMAEPCDSGAVEATFRSALPRLRAAFGFLDFSTLIENSLYPLVGLSHNDEVIAFAAFSDTPSVPGGVFGKRAMDAKAWAVKEASSFGFTVQNSLWIEVCASSLIDFNSQEKYLKPFLSALFKLSPETRVVLDLSPFEHANVLGILKPVSRSQDLDLILSMCSQSAVLPTLDIKQAVVENYDDLFPIVEHAQIKGCSLSNIPNSAAPMYPFAMARLIAAQDANNHVLVAEVENKLIGVVAVTSELDSRLFSGSKLDVLIQSASTEHGKDVKDVGIKKMHPNAPAKVLSISSPASADNLVKTSTYSDDQTNMQCRYQNAFQITMFCLEEEFGNRAIDLLMASFVFEGKDSCIVQLPYNNRAPDFIRYFTYVPTKGFPGKVTEEHDLQLYILNRQSLSPSFEVRLAKPQDIESIKDLSKGFQDFNLIQNCIERPIKGCVAMVASCQSEVVGFALVDTNCPIEAMFSHFELRRFMNINQQQEANQAAVIALLFMSSLFANRQRLFFREIMQQMSKTRLFLPVFGADYVSNVLEDMVLVPGRLHTCMYPPCTWAQVSPQMLPSSRSSIRGSIQQSATNSAMASKIGQYIGFDCALFTMTHRLLSRHKTIVNSRIVVIGASQAAAACLSELITSTNLKFTRLTLVSPYDLKSLCNSSKTSSDVELGPANAFQKMGINCLVNVMVDTMINLDRKAKLIHLSSGNHVQYDYLILSTGLQDQTRSKIQGSPNKGVVRFDELFVMINENTVNFTDTDSPVVIYGLSLQTFCSIHLLLSKGIPGSLLVVVYPELEPLDSFAEQCFKDSFIAASVMKEVRAAGVIERSGFNLLEVIHGEGQSVLQGVGLEKMCRASSNTLNQSENARICIKQPCRLLIACTQPNVDHALFQAVRKEGLVFNGRIVVDGNFQTNDPNIFACGSVAKFSRQCGKQLNHELFNSCELGRALAKCIISLFSDHLPDQDKLWSGLLPDPFETIPQASPMQSWPRTSIPSLIQAKGVSALLPGNFYYFHIKCPALHSNISKDPPMQPLIVKKDDWLLKIELTKTQEIGSIIYCGKVNLEAWKFIRLVGCHDPLLSNLFCGNSKAIMNISDFFSQPWFTLIFHDKFLDFYTELCLNAYHILNDFAQDQNLVREVVKNGFIMFLNAYKADFPGLSISSPWFSRKPELSCWRGKEDTPSNARRHCKAGTKNQVNIAEELKEIPKEKLCIPVEASKEEVEYVPDLCQTGTLTRIAEQAGTISVIKQHSTTELLMKGELELAVERKMKQIVQVEGQILAAREGDKEKNLSQEEELELLVEKIVKQLVREEAMNTRNLESERNVKSSRAKLSEEIEVKLTVRQIMEKLIAEEAKKGGGSTVTVKLVVAESEEVGVFVQKAQVKLLVDGESSRLMPGV